MLAALRVSNGSVESFPMRQVIQAFAPLAASASVPDRKNAFLMLGEFILQLSLEPFLPETKCVATKAFFDTFPTDPANRRQLEHFSVACAKAMNLNPVGKADFLRCFDQWKREKLTL
jgi:hypothetical protein